MRAEHAGYRQDVQEGAYPEKKKSVVGQFPAVKYRSETHCWTQTVSKEDYGVDKYWVILAVVRGTVFFSRLRFAYVDHPAIPFHLLVPA